MHDNQLEDRLRAVLREEGEALPLTITPEELERRLSVRRRERMGRRFSLVAAGVGVVALGSALALSTGWLRDPNVGSGPSAGPSVTANATLPPTPEPTTAELNCSVLQRNEADQPPSVVLGLSPGDSIPHFGALGAYQLGDRQAGEAGDWTAIDADRLDPIGAGPPAQHLEALAGSDYTCLMSVAVDAVPIDDVGATPLGLPVLTTGPARVLEYGLPPVGEWLVRVRAVFMTAAGTDAWSETFFRIDARNPYASLGPVLGSLPLLATPPATVFVDEHSENLEPMAPTGANEATIVGSVPPRSRYLIYVVCLGPAPLRWSIGHEGGTGFLAAGDQACNGNYGEQAVEFGTPSAPLDVVVQGDPSTAWRLRVATTDDEPSFIPPPLRMWVTSDPDGEAGSAESFGRCVLTPERSEPCGGEWFVLDGAKGLLAPVGSSVTVALEEGWEVSEARITAVTIDQARADPLPPEYSVALVESGGAQVAVATELGRGAWIVRVALNATKDGATFGAHYDFLMSVGD